MPPSECEIPLDKYTIHYSEGIWDYLQHTGVVLPPHVGFPPIWPIWDPELLQHEEQRFFSTMYSVRRPMDKNVHPHAGHTSAQWGFLHGMLNGAQQLPAYNS